MQNNIEYIITSFHEERHIRLEQWLAIAYFLCAIAVFTNKGRQTQRNQQLMLHYSLMEVLICEASLLTGWHTSK